MKAVIFARVSTQEQETDGHSIDAQIAKLREYSQRNDLEIIKEFEVVESSTRGERPEFYKMIEFVKAQKGQIALVCDKVDRLQRSFTELPILDKLRKENKLIIHFLDIGKMDSDSNSQQISFYQMSVVMANAYTNAISDNVKRSIIHKLNNGEYIGKAPLGYLNIRDDNDKSNIIIDESRAYLVQKMFEVYSNGSVSLGDLEKFAVQHNLTNNFFKGRAEKPITKNVISNILRNPFYCGSIYVKKYNKFYPHKYQPLISNALFNRCQEITLQRSAANNRIQAIQTAGKDFVFRSLIKCAITGRTVSSDRKEAKKNKNTYLITWNPEDITKKIYVPENDILKQVSDVFKSIAVPQDMLDEITSYLQQSHEAEKEYHGGRINVLRKEEDNIQSKINRLLDLYLERSITEAVYQAKNKDLETQLAKVRAEKEIHQGADSNFKTTVSTAFGLASKASELFESSKTSEKKELIAFVFSNLSLRGAKLEYTLRKPFDMMVNLANRSSWLHTNNTNPLYLSIQPLPNIFYLRQIFSFNPIP
jgi:site-specific DNA recombinase